MILFSGRFTLTEFFIGSVERKRDFDLKLLSRFNLYTLPPIVLKEQRETEKLPVSNKYRSISIFETTSNMSRFQLMGRNWRHKIQKSFYVNLKTLQRTKMNDTL